MKQTTARKWLNLHKHTKKAPMPTTATTARIATGTETCMVITPTFRGLYRGTPVRMADDEPTRPTGGQQFLSEAAINAAIRRHLQEEAVEREMERLRLYAMLQAAANQDHGAARGAVPVDQALLEQRARVCANMFSCPVCSCSAV
jgi:hypothetical protein